MATYGAQDYTNFRAVNLRGSSTMRLQGTDAAGTVRVDHLEADRAWSFPDKSGRFPIMGTFAVQFAATAANIFSTLVTVAGIRTEDALVVLPNRGTTAGYNFIAGGTYAVVIAALPGAGNINLVFHNPGQATGYIEQVYSYVAVR